MAKEVVKDFNVTGKKDEFLAGLKGYDVKNGVASPSTDGKIRIALRVGLGGLAGVLGAMFWDSKNDKRPSIVTAVKGLISK